MSQGIALAFFSASIIPVKVEDHSNVIVEYDVDIETTCHTA